MEHKINLGKNGCGYKCLDGQSENGQETDKSLLDVQVPFVPRSSP